MSIAQEKLGEGERERETEGGKEGEMANQLLPYTACIKGHSQHVCACIVYKSSASIPDARRCTAAQSEPFRRDPASWWIQSSQCPPPLPSPAESSQCLLR